MDIAVGGLDERAVDEPALSLADVRAAAARIHGRVLRTPSIGSEAINQATGAEVTLKLDTLQAVGSFKERGAANRLALLDARERARGVVAMSAGNHAQGVARHAALLGIRAVIVMPSFTPLAKVSRTAGYGAEVVLHGATLAESMARAHAMAAEQGLVFIHPYDDLAIIAGQGTLALELLEDAPGLDMLVVPIGGGGLIAGCAAAAKGINPAIEIIGVQVASHASLAAGTSRRCGGRPWSAARRRWCCWPRGPSWWPRAQGRRPSPACWRTRSAFAAGASACRSVAPTSMRASWPTC